MTAKSPPQLRFWLSAQHSRRSAITYLFTLLAARSADHIGVEIKAINRIVNQKTSLTPLLALKLAAAFGNTAEFWMNLQNACEIWEIRNSDVKLPKKISA